MPQAGAATRRGSLVGAMKVEGAARSARWGRVSYNLDMTPAERQLLDDISEPDEGVVRTLGQMAGDLLLLGAGGKIGHGLALMARRALDEGGGAGASASGMGALDGSGMKRSASRMKACFQN